MQRLKSQRGSAVLMAVVGLLFLGGLGVTTVSLVSTNQAGKVNALAADQAAALAQAGIEYAKLQLNKGASPAVNGFAMGPGTFTVAAVPNSGLITSTGQVGSAQKTYSLTTPFGKDCVDLNVTNANAASNNIVGIKLEKSCLDSVTITHWTFSWNPDQSEKTTKLQVQGSKLATLYDDPNGFATDTMIDAVDFMMPNNSVYPVNKIEFKDKITQGKTYTTTIHLADGSSVTKSFQDKNDDVADNGNDTPADPNDSTPGYEVNDNGGVVVDANKQVEVKALCAEITYGAGGPDIPVRAWLGVDNAYNTLFNGQPVLGGEVFTAASGAGTQYTVKANAKYQKKKKTYFNKTYTSTNTQQVRTLINGQLAPPLAGFGGQKPITECIANYINPQNGFVTLNTNQVLLLFELGVNMKYDPNSPAADFQDLVVLMTID